jgi:hypothetical protein
MCYLDRTFLMLLTDTADVLDQLGNPTQYVYERLCVTTVSRVQHA